MRLLLNEMKTTPLPQFYCLPQSAVIQMTVLVVLLSTPLVCHWCLKFHQVAAKPSNYLSPNSCFLTSVPWSIRILHVNAICLFLFHIQSLQCFYSHSGAHGWVTHGTGLHPWAVFHLTARYIAVAKPKRSGSTNTQEPHSYTPTAACLLSISCSLLNCYYDVVATFV